MVSSGLSKVGFKHIWLDDGWVVGRDNKTGMLLEDRVLFPSGMGNITSHIHQLGLKFGERDLTNNRIYSIRHGGDAPTFSYIPSAMGRTLPPSHIFHPPWGERSHLLIYSIRHGGNTPTSSRPLRFLPGGLAYRVPLQSIV